VLNTAKYSDIPQNRERLYIVGFKNKSSLCPTLTANMGTGGHNVPIIKDKKGIRKLTPRECARLQGFSDNFILPHDFVEIRIIQADRKQRFCSRSGIHSKKYKDCSYI
jgi:site-specific DNA-cytosine methylase